MYNIKIDYGDIKTKVLTGMLNYYYFYYKKYEKLKLFILKLLTNFPYFANII